MKVQFNIRDKETVLRNHGLQKSGPVQKLVDSEAMRYMSDYMPRRQAGELEHMMVMATVIGSGQIDTPGPYAHYLHEGVVYVDPKYNCAGWLSLIHILWIATEINLHHDNTIKEAFNRQLAAQRLKVFWDLNPDNPRAVSYTHLWEALAHIRCPCNAYNAAAHTGT